MQNTQLEAGVAEQLTADLEALPGVQRAIVAGPPWQAYLVCDADASPAHVQAAVHALLVTAGLPVGDLELHLAYLSASGSERRVRFHRITLDHPRIGTASAAVALEWGGTIFHGVDEGEGGPAGELRVAAKATLRALQAVLEDVLTFELVGIKALRVFDHDLVAVLVRCLQVPDRRLIGITLVSGEIAPAASRAVLNATNRLLGNYLVVGE